MRAYFLVFNVLAFACVTLPVVGACSGSTTTTGVDADASPSTAPSPEAGTCAVDYKNPCNTLAHSTVVVTSTCGEGTAPPATGGTITEGTYVLTAESNYPPTCTGHPDVLAAALSYHAGVIDQLIDSDPQCTQPSMPNPSSAFTSTLSMHGTSFTMQDTCGSNTGKSREDDYSATSTTLILRATNGSFSRTYTLVP